MDYIEINLKKYGYTVPKKVEELKKDSISLEDLLNIIDDYEYYTEQLEQEINELRNSVENDESEYIEDWLESRSK